ncbi:MAG: murein biosynthesis integral membrane protein MurJ [Candidatus Moranbacteria bacterium]|nr:murein biosynthesis integral membrane protein MurJ [Candidatus Moranbacteria bacterium]
MKENPIKNLSSQVQKNAFLIAGFSILSSFLGMLRDRILASKFGAGDTLDVYNAAFNLPDFIYQILIIGGVSSAFVPIFSSYLTKNKKKAFQIASSFFNLIIITILILSIISYFSAPYILKLLVPGFEGAKFQNTVTLTRIMLLSPIIMSISGIFAGILTTFKKFITYSMAPVMYNVGIITGIYLFSEKWGLLGLGFAVVLGALLHMLIQLPSAFLSGFRPTISFKLDRKLYLKIRSFIVPRSINMLVNQLNLIFITIISSTLASGSLSVFKFANNLATIPLTIFGAPFAIAAFADLSFAYNKQKMKKFNKIFSSTFTQIAFFVIPAAIMILIFRAQLVRLFFGVGKFDWEDTTLTLNVLGFLSVSLFFQSVIPLVSRAFFAIHNALIPFLSGVIALCVNVVLSLYFSKNLGIEGVALGFSISQIANLTFMLTILYIKIGGFKDHEIASSIVKICFSALLGGILAYFLKHYLGDRLGTDTFLKIFLQTAIPVGLGGVLYLFLSWYLGIREIDLVKNKLKKIKEKIK